MALTKTVNIDGKDVTFRASAAIPRIYRNKFHRDIFKDLHDLQKSIDENDPENSASLTVELEDVNTGVVESVSETNMVTNLVNDLLGMNPMGLFYKCSGQYDEMMECSVDILEQETGSAGLRQGAEKEHRKSADAAGLHVEGAERYASGSVDRAEGGKVCQGGFGCGVALV